MAASIRLATTTVLAVDTRKAAVRSRVAIKESEDTGAKARFSVAMARSAIGIATAAIAAADRITAPIAAGNQLPVVEEEEGEVRLVQSTWRARNFVRIIKPGCMSSWLSRAQSSCAALSTRCFQC